MNIYRSGLALLTSLGLATLGSAADVQDAAYHGGSPNMGDVAPVSCGDCGEAACSCAVLTESCGCGGPCDGGCYEPGFEQIFETKLLRRGCCLGDPWSLFGQCCGLEMGGWVQLGYHNKALALFNSRPDEYQLQQSWWYAEKAVDGSQGWDIGGRIDYIYGTDGPDTQAFGINNSHWDNQWDNGPDYGHAIPQVYMEVAYGDLSVKVGKFFTIIGYEVVAAPDNFFYSHAYTMYNSEPFTHTGAIATYTLNEDVDVFGGYVLGWDSGFEDNGDAFLGGSSVVLSDDITVTSTSVVGRFADNGGGDERGYMNSLVVDVTLSEKMQYIFQNDILDTENNAGETVRETFGINQYLIRTHSDCLSYGARFEWWNVDADSQGFYGANAPAGLAALATGDYDIFALTLGLNYKPHANVTIRPEVRWDWVDGSTTNLAIADITLLEGNDDRQTTFGVDTIFVF